jgi:phenylacetate-CoA ligase
MSDRQKYFNERMATLSLDETHEVQEKALMKQLDYVWAKSPFYQKKFGEVGADRGDIKTLEDLAKLPVTMKTELRDSQMEAPPLGTYACAPPESIRRIYSTSGTTGRPTYIGVTRNDIEVWREATSRALWCGGFRPGDRMPLVVAPYLIAASYIDAIENVGTCIPVGVGATERLIGAFQNAGGNAFLSTSSYPRFFASSLIKRGIDPRSLGIKIILAGGEPGASVPSYRQQVEEAFGCQFLEMMGNGDMCGQIFSECEYKHGMHFIAQGIVHVEIVDPETLEPLEIKEGVTGELLYTSLQRECQPLVRFRTRDHVRVTQTSCECGRTGFGIRCIGRTDDMIIVSGVNVYPAAVRDVIASFAPQMLGTMEIQIEKEPPEGWMAPIKIKAEYSRDQVKAEDLGSLKKKVEDAIRDKLVFRADIEMVPPDTLPKYEYKAKLVRNIWQEG